MNRALRSILLCILYIFFCAAPAMAAGTVTEQDAPVAEDLWLNAYSAILLDMDNQIRRGKQSHMVSGRSEDRFCKGTHASLSIGSCHMDAAKLILRISQPFHQPCHALQRCHG